MADSNELAQSIARSLNASSKKGRKVAFFLDDEDSPTKVDEWVSTGSTLLDLAISNRPDGGLPVGKIVEFYGLPGSGKSLIASHVLANTQEKGGIAVYIDTENAVDPNFLETIGIDKDKGFIYVQEHRVGKIFEIIERIITKIRDKDNEKFVTVVVDSIAGMTTENEDASDYEKEGFATDKAIILSKSMRKLTNLLGRERILLLFTNQVRDNVGVMYGDKFVTPGGKAVPFHSSVRVELRKSKSIVETVKGQRSQIGAQIRPKVTKNRMGPPGRKCEFDLYFSSGIDDPGSFYDKLKAHGAIKHKGGGWYKLKARDSDAEDWYHEDGDLFTFRKNDSDDEDAFFRVVNRNKPFRELCFEHLYENEIMTYDKDWTGSANKEYADAEDADPREAGQAGLSDQTRSEEAEEAGA